MKIAIAAAVISTIAAQESAQSAQALFIREVFVTYAEELMTCTGGFHRLEEDASRYDLLQMAARASDGHCAEVQSFSRSAHEIASRAAPALQAGSLAAAESGEGWNDPWAIMALHRTRHLFSALTGLQAVLVRFRSDCFHQTWRDQMLQLMQAWVVASQGGFDGLACLIYDTTSRGCSATGSGLAPSQLLAQAGSLLSPGIGLPRPPGIATAPAAVFSALRADANPVPHGTSALAASLMAARSQPFVAAQEAISAAATTGIARPASEADAWSRKAAQDVAAQNAQATRAAAALQLSSSQSGVAELVEARSRLSKVLSSMIVPVEELRY